MCTISLCMIVKNEEDVIARCLKSVAGIADEIIIADTGSEDATKEIASKFTDQIFDFEWIEDFSAARNFAFSKATQEYILWLDADDIILEEDRQKFLQLKAELNPDIDMVMMKYNTGFDASGNVTFSYYRERLFKRANNYQWVDPIHEVITPSGNLLYSDIAISHKKLRPSDPDRNLRIFEKMLREGTTFSARQTYYYGRELYYHGRYEEAIHTFEEFLEMPDAWIENKIEACKELSTCYRIVGNEKEMLSALFRSFSYDLPRAEICCDIGIYFFQQGAYRQAIFWYDLAGDQEIPEESAGFRTIDCYGFIPYLQLCLCYDKLGDLDKAKEYNEKAAKIKPDHPAVLYNRQYFHHIS